VLEALSNPRIGASDGAVTMGLIPVAHPNWARPRAAAATPAECIKERLEILPGYDLSDKFLSLCSETFMSVFFIFKTVRNV
jgi:hypothetical protein